METREVCTEVFPMGPLVVYTVALLALTAGAANDKDIDQAGSIKESSNASIDDDQTLDELAEDPDSDQNIKEDSENNVNNNLQSELDDKDPEDREKNKAEKSNDADFQELESNQKGDAHDLDKTEVDDTDDDDSDGGELEKDMNDEVSEYDDNVEEGDPSREESGEIKKDRSDGIDSDTSENNAHVLSLDGSTNDPEDAAESGKKMAFLALPKKDPFWRRGGGGWSSRRRGSSSWGSRRRASSWGSRRRAWGSRRRTSSSWGSRWGSRRRGSSMGGSRRRSFSRWISRRRASSGGGTRRRIFSRWGSRRRASSKFNRRRRSRIWGARRRSPQSSRRRANFRRRSVARRRSSSRRRQSTRRRRKVRRRRSIRRRRTARRRTVRRRRKAGRRRWFSRRRISRYLKVRKGQLTFNSEGNNKKGSRYYSRKPHVPGKSSGITLGRGYDMGLKSVVQIATDLLQAGLSSGLAKLFSKGAGLKGQSATEFLEKNKLQNIELTEEQQKKLFEISYARHEAEAKRLTKKYYKTTWNSLNPKIQQVLTDMVFRGDLRPTKNSLAQNELRNAVKKNDLEKFKQVLSNRLYWKNVPIDRFDRRVKFLEGKSS